MAASLRGQLGLKSGPLAPTSAKLTTQMLVVSHMDNHYKKINKAKPAIDNGPPKSMLCSQKMRDRQSRHRVGKQGSRPSSRMTQRADSVGEDILDEDLWSDPEDDEDCQVRDIMRTTLRTPLKAQHGIVNVDTEGKSDLQPQYNNFGSTTRRPQSATMRGIMQAMQGRPRPVSARSTTSVNSHASQASRRSQPMKVTYDGDVLNKHAHSFTEPAKPFTPRTLRSNRESSLKRYKYYTPPPRKSHKSNKDENQGGAEGEMDGSRGGPSNTSLKDVEDLGATETLTETMLMEMSLQSHSPQQGRGESGVPRLDISMDKDHLSWVQDQASRTQNRVNGKAGSHH